MEKSICPECGQEVLPDATVCGNCGCKITVCPDCGTVYKEGQVRCTACGRVLSEEVFHGKIKADAKKIEARLDTDLRRDKTLSRIGTASGILGIALIALAVLVGYLWSKQADVEKLLNMRSRRNLCLALMSIGIIVFSLEQSVMDFIKDILGSVFMCRWIDETKFDYRQYIRMYDLTGKDKNEQTVSYETTLYCDKLAKTALFYESKKERVLLIISVIIHFLLGIGSVVSTIIWGNILFKSIFTITVTGTGNACWYGVAFYSTIIFFVLNFLWDIVLDLIISKKAKNKKKEILASKN